MPTLVTKEPPSKGVCLMNDLSKLNIQPHVKNALWF